MARRRVRVVAALAILLAGTLLPPPTSAGRAGLDASGRTAFAELANQPPIANDDPDPACGPTFSGGGFPIPEDWGDFVFVGAGTCSIGYNDSDPDGDSIVDWEVVQSPAHGTATMLGDGWVAYRPDPDFSTPEGDAPSDKFTYRISDGQAWSQPATMRLWIAPVNDAPSFTPGAPLVSVIQNSGSYTAPWATDIRPGPAWEDHQAVTFQVTSDEADAFAVPPAIAPDGTLTFTPALNAIRLVHVTVVAHDDGGLEDYSGVEINPADTSAPVSFQIVITENHPPTATDDAFSVPEGAPATALAVLANDSTSPDADETLSIIGVTPAAHGVVAITGGGSGVTYRPQGMFSGLDGFSYTISDGHGGTDSASVALTVVRDTTPPTVVVPQTAVRVGVALGTSSVSGRVTWSASDAGSGIRSYQLQESLNGAAYRTVALAGPTARAAIRTLTLRATYRFRVRATDGEGNTSGWTYGPTIRAAAYQESTSLASYAGSWQTLYQTSASGGKTRYATSKTSTVSFHFNGRDVALVAPRFTSSGRVKISIDGVLVTTVDLDTSSAASRQVVFQRHFPSSGSHTLQLQVYGDGRVDVDAFVVLR